MIHFLEMISMICKIYDRKLPRCYYSFQSAYQNSIMIITDYINSDAQKVLPCVAQCSKVSPNITKSENSAKYRALAPSKKIIKSPLFLHQYHISFH